MPILAFVKFSPKVTIYHHPVVWLVVLVYYTPLVDGVDGNVFFELVVFLVVMVWWGGGVVVVVTAVLRVGIPIVVGLLYLSVFLVGVVVVLVVVAGL